MSPIRALLDRLLRSRLPLALALLLLGSQWLTVHHGVLHPPGASRSAAAAAAVAAMPGKSLPGNAGRSDSTGHAHGDGVCLLLSHLLLDSPPTAERPVADPVLAGLSLAWQPATEPIPVRLHRAQAARAPPVVFG